MRHMASVPTQNEASALASTFTKNGREESYREFGIVNPKNQSAFIVPTREIMPQTIAFENKKKGGMTHPTLDNQ
jgi:hypothetical protein